MCMCLLFGDGIGTIRLHFVQQLKCLTYDDFSLSLSHRPFICINQSYNTQVSVFPIILWTLNMTMTLQFFTTSTTPTPMFLVHHINKANLLLPLMIVYRGISPETRFVYTSQGPLALYSRYMFNWQTQEVFSKFS